MPYQNNRGNLGYVMVNSKEHLFPYKKGKELTCGATNIFSKKNREHILNNRFSNIENIIPEMIGEYYSKEDLIDKMEKKHSRLPIDHIHDKIAKELVTYYTDEKCPLCLSSCLENSVMKITNCCNKFICKLCNLEWEKIDNRTCPFCRKHIYSGYNELYTVIPVKKYKEKNLEI